MTVQELINRLEELSDKELQVKIYTNKPYHIYECYAAYVTTEGDF